MADKAFTVTSKNDVKERWRLLALKRRTHGFLGEGLHLI